MVAKKQNILFLCTGNSCRSQMAEGWVRHLHDDRFDDPPKLAEEVSSEEIRQFVGELSVGL